VLQIAELAACEVAPGLFAEADEAELPRAARIG
jgi:hypothetical protein